MRRVVFLFFLFLTSIPGCETPPDPYAKPVRQATAPKVEAPPPDAPFVPPLDVEEQPPADENLPDYLKPRPSRFSKKMWRRIQDAADEFVSLRHTLHGMPELAHREVNTARVLASQLEPLGLKLVGPLGLTGFAAVLEGTKPGPTVGIVVGMDGVAVPETTRLPYASRTEGYWEGQKVPVAHALGRDVEMAVAVGVAKLLASMKENVPGRVVFIFQPGSGRLQPGENPGAQDVIASGVLSRLGIEALFHFPVDPALPVGKAGVIAGAVSGGSTRFSVTITGTQSRICSGDVPWKCVDPIAVAAHLIEELLMLPSKHFGPNRQVVLNIGRIEGGESGNMVASNASIQGMFRWLMPADAAHMQQLISRTADGAARAAGAKITVQFEPGPQGTGGHAALVRWSVPTLVRCLGRKGVMPGDPLAEPGDFSLYQKELSTAMILLGCGRVSRDTGRRGEGNFAPDDETVLVGVHTAANIIMDYLHDEQRPAPLRPLPAVKPAADPAAKPAADPAANERTPNH